MIEAASNPSLSDRGRPFYQDDSCTLFCGDVLKPGPIGISDLFVTDPPYSRAGALHSGTTSAAGKAALSADSDQFWLHWFTSVAGVIVGHVKENGCGLVFCDYRTIHLVERAFGATGSGWAMTQGIVWNRDSIGLGSPFRAMHEMIAFVRGPRFRWTGRRDVGNVITHRWPYGEHSLHPAEKPVGLLRFLIEVISEPGQRVLDPFAGSGSTLVAARESGRRAVGIELDERHCATAADRLRQGLLLPLPATCLGCTRDEEAQLSMIKEGAR